MDNRGNMERLERFKSDLTVTLDQLWIVSELLLSVQKKTRFSDRKFSKMCIGRNLDLQIKEVKLENSMSEKKSMWNEDALAISTKYTKTVLFGLGSLLENFQNSTIYKWVNCLNFIIGDRIILKFGYIRINLNLNILI